MNLMYEDETYAIRGACYAVYNELGPGFLEAVYQEALAREFTMRGIPFSEQDEIRIMYHGEWLNQTYRADFICYGKIIVELKAVTNLIPGNGAQVMNYLKATGLRLGLLVNFGQETALAIQRIAI